MNNKKLLRAIGNIRDDLIADAVIEEAPQKAGRIWMTLAACLCILLAGTAVLFMLPKNPGDPHLDYPTIGITPFPSINLSNLQELQEMREMSVTQDEAALEAYLRTIKGQGARSRQDLLDFLELVDSIPVVQLMDGSVCLLSHEKGQGVGSGEYYNILKLGFEKANGDWIRLDYILSVEDIAAKEQEVQSAPGITALDIDLQIEATGDRLRVFGERREQGRITWYLSVNGIYAQVTYRAADADTVNTAQIFQGLSVIRISDLRA